MTGWGSLAPGIYPGPNQIKTRLSKSITNEYKMWL